MDIGTILTSTDSGIVFTDPNNGDHTFINGQLRYVINCPVCGTMLYINGGENGDKFWVSSVGHNTCVIAKELFNAETTDNYFCTAGFNLRTKQGQVDYCKFVLAQYPSFCLSQF